MKRLDLNTAATIIGPIFVSGVIGAAIWAFNTKLDNQQLRMEKAIAETYVTKEAFKLAVQETNEHFKQVDVDFRAVRGDLARLAERRGNLSPRQQEQQ